MNAGAAAPLRRSTRTAALDAVARLRHSTTAAAGSRRAPAAQAAEADGEGEGRSRKRQRVSTSAAAPKPAVAPKPAAAKAKPAQAGPSRDDERRHWLLGQTLVAGEAAARAPASRLKARELH